MLLNGWLKITTKQITNFIQKSLENKMLDRRQQAWKFIWSTS